MTPNPAFADFTIRDLERLTKILRDGFSEIGLSEPADKYLEKLWSDVEREYATRPSETAEQALAKVLWVGQDHLEETSIYAPGVARDAQRILNAEHVQ